MSTNIKAAAKLREAMRGIRATMASASPAEKKQYTASMLEIRNIYKSIVAADEAEAPAEPAPEAEFSEEDEEEGLDLPMSTIEELGFDDEDEILAHSALDLAAHALKAMGDSSEENDDSDEAIACKALDIAARALQAAEDEAADEEAEASDGADDEQDEQVEDAASDEAASDEDMADEADESDATTEYSGDLDSELAQELGGDDLGGDDEAQEPGDEIAEDGFGLSDDGLPSADDLASDAPIVEPSLSEDSDFDAPPPPDSGESQAQEALDDSGALSEEDLIALEQEGLLQTEEAPVDVSAKLREVAARIQKMAASSNKATTAAPASASFIEDESPESLSFSEYAELMASYSPEERAEILRSGSAVAAKKFSPADVKKMERNEVRNRVLRKKRGPVLKSKAGRKASVSLPGGKRKAIKKKFYFTLFDSKGNKLGQHWMATKKPSKDTLAAYEKKNGVKHPFMLPIDPKAVKSAKSKGKR